MNTMSRNSNDIKEGFGFEWLQKKYVKLMA